MFFDGAINIYSNEADVIIISSNKKQYTVSVKLSFECFNNIAEYEPCILNLEVTLKLKIRKIDAYDDLSSWWKVETLSRIAIQIGRRV